FVAGFIDEMAYTYCNWSTANNCNNLNYSSYTCPNSATEMKETDWTPVNFHPPMQAFFTVPDSYQFDNPTCSNSFICWPTIAPSSMEVYENYPQGIPGWEHSLLVSSLKKGLLYRMTLSPDGKEILGDTLSVIRTQNRYRDFAVDPSGTTIYVVTDNDGRTSTPTQTNTQTLLNPGTILKFTYTGPTSIDPQEALPGFVLWRDEAAESLSFPAFSPQTRKIRVTNLQGQVIAETSSRDAQQDFSTVAWPVGVYLIQVQGENGKLVTKKWILR
ncbi:MAG: T9SS type A sorting domain-containing protein, partial [Bacteroidia bacterium]|nr:T9SS type A sorting domain-containing protein [Bacteroidia bacterium]